MSNITISPLKNPLQMMSSTVFMELLEKDHGNVLRDMRSMLIGLYGDDYLAHHLASEKGERRSEYIRANGDTIFRALFEDDSNWNHQQWRGFTWERDERGYLISISFDRSHSMTFASGYDVKLRKRIVDRLEALEKAAILPEPTETKPTRVRGRTPLDQVKVINFVGDALKDVPGIRLDVVAAAKLQAFEQHTGIDFSEFRRALPPVTLERMVHLNPTQIGARIVDQTGRAKCSSQLVNKVLLELGLQRKVEDGYVLTEAGTKYGEVLPFKAKNAHHGNQIDWWESVVDVVRENMPATDGKRGSCSSVIPLKPRQNPDEPQAALL